MLQILSSPENSLFNVNKCHIENEILNVKVAQLCPTICDSIGFSMDFSMEFSRPEYLSRQPLGQNTGVDNLSLLQGIFSIKPRSLALQMASLAAEPQGKPKHTGVDRLFLLQWIFPTQELNRGLLHCRWILYQLSYQGSPSGACLFLKNVGPLQVLNAKVPAHLTGKRGVTDMCNPLCYFLSKQVTTETLSKQLGDHLELEEISKINLPLDRSFDQELFKDAFLHISIKLLPGFATKIIRTV